MRRQCDVFKSRSSGGVAKKIGVGLVDRRKRVGVAETLEVAKKFRPPGVGANRDGGTLRCLAQPETLFLLRIPKFYSEENLCDSDAQFHRCVAPYHQSNTHV